jgi:hypothetical protein
MLARSIIPLDPDDKFCGGGLTLRATEVKASSMLIIPLTRLKSFTYWLICDGVGGVMVLVVIGGGGGTRVAR